MKKSIFVLLSCLLLLGGCEKNSGSTTTQDNSNKNQDITATQEFSPQLETISEEKLDSLNSFVPTRIFAASDFAIYLQEDGSITYLYRKEGWDYPDFKEYTCGAIIEDSAYPGIITQDLKARIHEITAEEFGAELKEAAANAEPVSAGTYSLLERMEEEETWQDVQQMLCRDGSWYAALRKDGTVVSLGIFASDKVVVEDWSDVVQIAAARSALYGLKADGSVYAHLELSSPALQGRYEQTVSTWQDIVQIASGDISEDALFGLRKDGTVVSMTGLFSSQCETWSGITAIAASRYALVGIREDGTLAIVCEKESGFSAEDVSEWKNIESVAVCDEYCVAVGSDGTLYRTNADIKNNIETAQQSPAEAAAVETEGLIVFSGGAHVFSCDLPKDWDYSLYPSYSKSFFEQEGEVEGGLCVYFHYSETDPNALISISAAGARSEKQPLGNIAGESEKFLFADGSSGIRKVLDGEYYYKEYIYHPAAEYYITLITSKQNYLEHEDELRTFLDSIAFEQYKVSRQPGEEESKTYRMVVWNPYLQAQLTVKAGLNLSSDWDWVENGHSYEYVMQRLKLYPDGNFENGLVIEPPSPVPVPVSEKEKERTWERCRFASGLTAYRTVYEEEGEMCTEYKFVRSGCRVKVYGQETEEITRMLDSLDIR